MLCAEMAVASSRAAKICMRAMARAANQKILTLVLVSRAFKKIFRVFSGVLELGVEC